jgi:hypothetical protein
LLRIGANNHFTMRSKIAGDWWQMIIGWWWRFWLLLRPGVLLNGRILALSCALILVFAASHAAAQGCAMCYQNAAASGTAGRAALRHGILVLLLPAVCLFLGVFALIYRRRNAAR